MDGIDLLREVAPGDLQFVAGAHRLDLTWGHPDPTLLPVGELATATEAVLRAPTAWRALSYGNAAGSARLRELLADRTGTHPDELVVTAGSSGAFDLYLHVHAEPGDVVVVEQPTYFLALRIIADRGLRLVGLPPGAEPGPALAETVARLRAGGHRGRTFAYVCPTHGNPTGRTLDDTSRRALVEAAATAGVTVIEDDVYSELGHEPVTPLATLAPAHVVRLGSFSKTLAPGLRLGYLRADPAVTRAVADCGLLDSGGGVNPLVAAAVAELVATGTYDAVVARLRATYAERMRTLLDGVDGRALPAGRPTGGYFAWLRAAEGVDLVASAAAAGVAVSPAAVFHVDGADDRLARASCSLLGPADLADAGVRLHEALGWERSRARP